MRIAALLPEPLRRRSRQADDSAVEWCGRRGLLPGETGRPASVMMTAPVAETERGSLPGSLTPQAQRGLEEASARHFARITAGDSERLVPAEAGEHPGRKFPYPGIPDMQLAAYRHAAASELLAAQPEFHPAPFAAPVTAPMQALPGNAKVPPPPPPPAVPVRQPRPVRHASANDTDLALLTRVRDGLEKKWHIEAFLADKHELPCFAATTRIAGWQGLHLPPKPIGWRRWSTAPWAAREQALADAACAQARAELNAIHARYAAEALAAEVSR